VHHLLAVAHGLELTPIYSIVHDCCQPNWDHAIGIGGPYRSGQRGCHVGKGLRFSLRHAPRAHICRYCLISESRKRSALPFARFERLVHCFHNWKQSTRRDDFQIRIFVGPSFDYDLETLQGIAKLYARRGAKFQIFNVGGLRIRSSEALIEWLEERRTAGITGFHASLAGYGEIHDRWNGRAGDFDYQTSILRLAGERGMVRQEKLFLTQNTLPIFNNRLSEREWIPIMLETADQPRKLLLKLDVDETNIDYLEHASCEEIFAERERQYQESIAAFLPLMNFARVMAIRRTGRFIL
jgi:hypothetical protein